MGKGVQWNNGFRGGLNRLQTDVVARHGQNLPSQGRHNQHCLTVKCNTPKEGFVEKNQETAPDPHQLLAIIHRLEEVGTEPTKTTFEEILVGAKSEVKLGRPTPTENWTRSLAGTWERMEKPNRRAWNKLLYLQYLTTSARTTRKRRNGRVEFPSINQAGVTRTSVSAYEVNATPSRVTPFPKDGRVRSSRSRLVGKCTDWQIVA